MKYDYLVVGSGLYGAIFAHEAKVHGKSVLVVDKRPNIAGNIYTENIEGINVHKYGAHIFHTNNKKVWNYITRFAEFNRFTNSPVANYKGELYSLPFNMYTFNKMWGVVTPEEAAAKIEEQRREITHEPQNLEEQAISLVGRDIYEKLIKGYTEKQWGRDCKDLPAFIIKRLPVRLTFDNNYFNALYQGIPIGGYTKMIADVQAIEGTSGIHVQDINVRYTRLFYLNKFDRADGTPSPLADVRVRQAIRYAIDMQTICDTLMNGGAVPANSLAPDENLKSDKLNNYSYDPEKARELLKEAGWDGTATLKCVYYYTDQATVDLMSAIQAYLADVGITFKAELVEGDLASILWTAPADQTNGPSAVDWDICYAANAALSLHEYYDRYRTGSATNSHTPEDPELNALIDATSASADVNVQNEAFRALIEYENEDLFCMALYYQPIFLITSDRISGMKVGTPQYCIDWDIQNWTVS